MRIRGEALSRGTRAEEATRGVLRQRATPGPGHGPVPPPAGGGYPGHMATARAVTGAPAAVTCWTPILAKPAYSTASQQMWELIRWKPSAFKRKGVEQSNGCVEDGQPADVDTATVGKVHSPEEAIRQR
ncbi:Hypothetical predicted protein [Pelobates cultripes]|uniref:Uncharacterized protein n=1 Tax=Pelobates cultripes TaxID=61616 RepID=A0AAD1WAH4_PELCU|nr:Hypothetical predicted protein [Pelobates cultripes]